MGFGVVEDFFWVVFWVVFPVLGVDSSSMMGLRRWARFAQALRAFALLVLSGSNRRAGGPEGPCFRIGAGGRKRAFGPVRSYTEMPRFSARHLLAIA